MDLYALTDKAIIQGMGKEIRRRRLERNMSQRDLAKTSGLSLTSVVNAENGCSLSLSSFIPILRAINGLELLESFFAEPEISPIAYAKLAAEQPLRKRASKSKITTSKNQSEW